MLGAIESRTFQIATKARKGLVVRRHTHVVIHDWCLPAAKCRPFIAAAYVVAAAALLACAFASEIWQASMQNEGLEDLIKQTVQIEGTSGTDDPQQQFGAAAGDSDTTPSQGVARVGTWGLGRVPRCVRVFTHILVRVRC